MNQPTSSPQDRPKSGPVKRALATGLLAISPFLTSVHSNEPPEFNDMSALGEKIFDRPLERWEIEKLKKMIWEKMEEKKKAGGGTLTKAEISDIILEFWRNEIDREMNQKDKFGRAMIDIKWRLHRIWDELKDIGK